MSKYKVIEVQFKNESSLVGALNTVFGSQYVEAGHDIEVKSAWMSYDGKKQRADIVVRSAGIVPPTEANNYGKWCSDIGFVKGDNGSYTMLVNDMDVAQYDQKLKAVKQQYALNEVTRQAKAKGYIVTPVRAADGTVTVSLKKF